MVITAAAVTSGAASAVEDIITITITTAEVVTSGAASEGTIIITIIENLVGRYGAGVGVGADHACASLGPVWDGFPLAVSGAVPAIMAATALIMEWAAVCCPSWSSGYWGCSWS